MAGLLNACVHSGLFLVVSGRLRVLQLTVSSRFWDQFFRSKGTDVAQRRMWNRMMDHCLGLGSGCVSLCVCVCVCVHARVCVSVSMPVHADGDQGFRIGPTVRAYMCADEHLRGSSKHMY